MLQLKTAYILPALLVSLPAQLLHARWIPEVSALAIPISESYAAWLNQNHAFEIRRHGRALQENGDYAALYSVWFRREPVFLCQSAGNHGQETYFRRWVTNSQAYSQLVLYLSHGKTAASVIAGKDDPERWALNAELFRFCGVDFCEELGIVDETQGDTFFVLAHPHDVAAGADPRSAVLRAPPECRPLPGYVQHGMQLFRQVRELSPAERASNQAVQAAGACDGFSHFYWYAPAPQRDASAVTIL